MTSTAQRQASVPTWQRRLLPGELVEAATGRRSVRDWVVDVLIIVAALTIGALNLAEVWSEHGGAMKVVDIVTGTAVCLALWVRRSHPVGVGVLAAVVAAFSAMAGGAVVVAVFNVAVRCSRRALTGIAALSLASQAIFLLLNPSAGVFFEQMLLGALIVAVAIGWGLFARARRELVYSLRERAERLESEQRLRVEQARDAVRRRIAREMHDVLAHRLSLLSVHAGALEFRTDASPDEVTATAGVIRGTAQTALQELRDVIGVLREDVDERRPQPTLLEIPALVEESREAGMRVRSHGAAERVPDTLGRTAYRVVQEGLTNARKHAPDSAVDVTLEAGPPFVVEVISRGASRRGAEERVSGPGAGLIGLAERVQLAGGELTHGRDAGGDFVLRATMPWAP